MMNIAEFTILGRVGKIKPFDGKTNVTIFANYSFPIATASATAPRTGTR